MNTKGASASGKSTLRPRQRKLAGDIGVRWSEFALISPDIWRKQLLDYATLGPTYKYGGAFTGEELQIIDKKLDRYMARKAERGEMTHLLIDRFRFDSFAPDSDEAGSNLLTRFGHDVYLFFMITPPEALVERAWKRGLEIGRYKAVDDTLAHGIEAYTGMPGLVFTWAKRGDKRVQFELLDNSVAAGERPRTVAFGGNRVLNVLDVKCMLDIERYRRVNVDATSPGELYREPSLLRPEHNAGFLRQCVEHFPDVNFADQATGRIYLAIRVGRARLVRSRPFSMRRSRTRKRARDSPRRRPSALDPAVPPADGPAYLDLGTGPERMVTLGAWGPTASDGESLMAAWQHGDLRRHCGAGGGAMALVPPIEYEAANAAVRAVYDDIRATRRTDYINNFWKVLAHDPATLARTWAQVKEVMGEGALDPLVKELIYIAVSVTNNCEYCIHSHTAAARTKGMTPRMFDELIAVTALANATNRLANGYRMDVDERYASPLAP